MRSTFSKIPKKYIIGIDEVGRGALAGPVTVCAVAMLSSYYSTASWSFLRDSKKLSPRQREKWCEYIHKNVRQGIFFVRVVSVPHFFIDTHGIASSVNKAASLALRRLDVPLNQSFIVSDYGITVTSPVHSIVKGDEKEPIISFASIKAKVHRDIIMNRYAKCYTRYAFETNKGYGTHVHRNSLRMYGRTPIHRITFIKKLACR